MLTQDLRAFRSHNLHVISPRCLPSILRLSSKSSKNPSSPCTSVLFAPNIAAREAVPTKPMTREEPIRHGRLGCSRGEAIGL